MDELVVNLGAASTSGPPVIEASALMEDDEHLELRLRMLCEGWIRKVIRSRNEAAQRSLNASR